MEPESTCSSKVCGNARSYKKFFSSNAKKGNATGESESEKCSPVKKIRIVKLDWADFKPRSSRKRKHFWLDRENKVSENIKNAKELDHVKNSSSTLSDRHGLEEKKRNRRLQDLEEKKRKRRLQEQNLANQLLELEEGGIAPSLSPENSFGSTSDKSDIEEEINGEPKRQSLFDILKDLEEGEIPTHSHCTNGSFRSVSGKEKISMNSQTGDILNNLVDIEDGEILAGPHDQMLIDKRKEGHGTSQLTSRDMEEQLETSNGIVQLVKGTERPVTMADDRNCRKVGTSQQRSTDKENETVQLGKETERPVTTSDGLCLSDSGFKVDKVQPTDMTATCSGSPNVPAHVSDVFLHSNELSTTPVGTVIDVESDTDSDVVELTDLKSVTSISNVKNNEVNSSFNGLKDGATGSASVGKQSPAQNDQIFDSVSRSSEDAQSTLDKAAMVDQAAECYGETIPDRNMQNTEKKSYSHGVEDGSSRSNSVEKQSIHKNKDIVDSIVKSSENLENSSDEVITVDQPAVCSSHALPIQEQSSPVEVANMPESHDRGAVPPVCMESHLQFTGTSASVVPPDVSAVESMPMTSNQPPVSSVSPSWQSGLLQCSQSVQTSGNDIHFHEPGSRIDAQDSRSMATGLASMDVNLLLPGRTQLPCYDPLQNEMEKLRKHHEQDLKMHEAMILHLKCKRDEEIEEIIKKYEILFQGAEAALQHKTVDYKTNLMKVYLHKVLANAYIHQPDDFPEASTPDTRQASSDAINLVQNPTQMSAVRLDQHPPVTVPFSPVIIQSSPMINQPSPVPARPFSAHMDSAIGFPQNGYPTRVVAPHLRASWRPHTNFPVSNSGELIQPLPMSSDNH